MIRVLKQSDISGLNRLPPVDWQFDYEDFLNEFLQEDYFHAFVLTEGEEIIGTGNVLLKDQVGWLANVIVDGRFRNRGLGYKITKHLVDFLLRKGCETQLLIATELGEPVYKKIGFKKVAVYHSFDTEVDNEIEYSKSIREIHKTDLEKIYALDKKINGENRKHLIDKYYQGGFGVFSEENILQGFYLPGFGRGLILSKTKEVGLELLKIKHSKKARRTLVPSENQEAVSFLQQLGVKEGKKSSKMILGRDNHWEPECIYSYASGYCG